MKIKMLFITLLLSIFSASSFGETMNLVNLLNDQVDAFNKKDIERLVDNVSDDFKWFYITSEELLVETKDKASFRVAMDNYYKNKRLNSVSRIDSYTVEGNKVSFKEVVSYKNKKGELVESSAMGIYQMKDNKIYRAWYFIE